MAGNGFSERRDMEALNAALERYERLLAKGASADIAAREASKLLTPGAAPLFVLADAVRVSARPLRTPAFAARMEAELLASHGRVRELAPRSSIQAARRRRSAGGMIMAFAACVAVLAGVLVGSSHSLPGDALYGMKRASEGAELAIVWGPSEAHVRLSLAETRLHEVQGLFVRAGTHVLGAPGSNVAGALDDMDPHIAQLIRDTLAAAEEQINQAAKILITEHSDSQALGRLATVANQGASIAKGVAAVLPSGDRPPVLTTSDNLAMVAVKATTVQQQVKQQELAAAPAKETPPPCPAPSPTPSPAATPSASPSSTPESTPAATPSATPSETPSQEPCVSPSPTPTPKPTPTATPEPASPKASPDSGKSAQASPAAQSDSSGGGSGAQAGSANQSSGSPDAGVHPAS